jgi:hypothetical protein
MSTPRLEEAALEDADDTFDDIDELIKDCNNRLTFQSLNVLESYRSGYMNVWLKVRSKLSGEEFDALLEAVPPQPSPASDGISRPPSRLGTVKSWVEVNTDVTGIADPYRQESDVLTDDIEIVKDAEILITSIMRLQSLYAFSGAKRKLLYSSLSSFLFEYLFLIADDKVSSFSIGEPVLTGEAAGEMVQGAAEGVGDAGDLGSQERIRGARQDDLIDFLLSLKVVVSNHSPWVRVRVRPNCGFYLTDVSLGPFNV